MTSQYKKFTKLIAKWPLDPTKGDRDFAKVIREKIKIAFDTQSKASLDSEACNKQYASLNKLADNHYLSKYKRSRSSSATGLSGDECRVILSEEVLGYLREENKGFFSKIFNKE